MNRFNRYTDLTPAEQGGDTSNPQDTRGQPRRRRALGHCAAWGEVLLVELSRNRMVTDADGKVYVISFPSRQYDSQEDGTGDFPIQ